MREGSNIASMPDQQAHRFGGLLAMIGGLGYFSTLLLHGDLPDHTTEAALEHIAGRPEWRMLKLALTASLLCWIGAFTALANTLPRGLSGLLARWAVAISTIGVTIVVVEYAIIGYSLKNVADAWVTSSAGEAEANLRLGEVMLLITGGLFHSFVALLLGLPIVLIGVAIAFGQIYPRWLGWVAVIAGAGPLLAGMTRFLGIDLVPYPLLYGGFVVPICFWLTAIGVFMWQRPAKAA